ncbi:MAG: Gfo/Idh/MocA family oxidoreductase [Phycisphaerales bacterium]|nr:Gfo/Idh/MocA family oxidoreductase [Phycisphaerales bacterium]
MLPITLTALFGLTLLIGSGFSVATPPARAAVSPGVDDFTKSTQTGPLRIAIIGMSHGHVEGLLWRALKQDDIQIVGVYEPDPALFDRHAKKYSLNVDLYYDNLDRMLDVVKPEAASVMTSIKDHRMAVEACAPRGVHMLVEKPLAFSNDDAQAMAELARKHRILLLTNFETSWYASVREARRLVDSGELAPIRRLVFRHGHKGPREIGCAPEFVSWLTDPEQNGGGAVVDFGCYGAVLATWMMNGERPTRVTATATTLKPDQYPHVDDDATIVLTYPTATAVIQASWAWTHDNKEMDVFAERGSIHTGKWDEISLRKPDAPAKRVKPPAKPAALGDEWTYLREVVRGKTPIDPLLSLDTNLIVAEILDTARAQIAAQSAVQGKAADSR